MSGNPYIQFNLSSKYTQTFGFAFDQNTADFDIAFSITVIRTKKEGENDSKYEKPILIPKIQNISISRKLLINSVGCIYIVSAAGAAQPDIRVNTYNGAICMWNKVPEIGENFLVDYALPY